MNNMGIAPKVSIVIPVYNVESYLAKCLDSCLEQTLYDIEIVCVDDGATDRSGEILDFYAAMDYRVRVIHKENEGVSEARNVGVAAATGAWIMFLDSDDYLHPLACEKIWEESLCNPSEIIVHGGFLVPDYPEPEAWKYWAVITGRRYFKDFKFPVMYERGSNPFLWLQAYSRAFLERNHAKFHKDITFGEDLIFQFENFPDAKGISFIDDRLYFYRWYREGSLMKEASQDLDLRTSRHISNIDVIARAWKKKDLFEDYGVELLKWALGFVIPDFQRLELKDVGDLALQLYRILEDTDLIAYRKGLDSVGRRNYRKLLQHMKSAKKE